MLGLVPYKPYFLYAIQSAAKTGRGICFPGYNPPQEPADGGGEEGEERMKPR